MEIPTEWERCCLEERNLKVQTPQHHESTILYLLEIYNGILNNIMKCQKELDPH